MRMKETNLSLPLLGLVGATRALIGFGLGLLLAERIRRRNRMRLGAALFGAGLLSTIPIGITIARGRFSNAKSERAPAMAY
jgi:hypothetical protein